MKYLILGAGISGKSLAKYLESQKKTFFLYDDRLSPTHEASPKNQEELPFLSLTESKSLIQEGELTLLVSPGVPFSHPLLTLAQQEKKEVLSELDFSLQKLTAPVIAVTGTNGKSTVVSMVHHVLQETGYKVALLGNIGTPASSILNQKEVYDFIVLEVSSYQLEQLKTNNFYRSAFLNFSKDHLERHKSLQNYFLAKWKIFQTTHKESKVFCGKNVFKQAENFGLSPKENTPPIEEFTGKDFQDFVPKNLWWPKHNLKNASHSLQIAASVTNKSLQELGKTLTTFQTIPHRFESFAFRKKVSFVDDSKATNIDATLSALNSLDGNILLLLGGLSKGTGFQEILSFKEKISKVLSFGAASATIKRELEAQVPVDSFTTLKELIKKLFVVLDQDPSIEYVLLSPSCSSFDEFKDFASRGVYFQEKVKLLLFEETKANGANRERQKKPLF